MRLLIVAAILAASPAFASDSMIARNGQNWLRLYDKPCSSEDVRALLRDKWKDKFRAAHSQANGQEFEACWLEKDGQVFVLFEDGDRLVLPRDAFKPDGA
jgi:hypothetical protein